ncbi:ABC transporter permease [Streptomyces bambusae]|uniref:ABC transporter permease n=1 Tax=Streptomyces bambusae TaxID=1550616 RepID=UPI001CFE1601|nr:ABC transporter permease [Streptomyces bambusae]MCB5165181.1 ABC transporter permease [Streptomyces bambusae]
MTAPAAARPAGYTSPLPETRPTLGHAVASEWTKMISLRSTVWTLGSLAGLVVGIGLIAVANTSDTDYSQVPFLTPALFGLFVGQLSVMALGVLTISSEYGTGLVRTTFTAAPERHRVLTAKFLVFTGVAFATTTASVMLVGLATALVHGGPDAGPHGAGEWLGALGGCVYVTLLGVLGLAVGAMLRHSAGAIAAMLGVVTLPPVLGGFLTVWESTQGLGGLILRYNAPVALGDMFGLPMGDDAGPVPVRQLLVLLLVTGAAVAGAYAETARRDV